MIVGFSSLGCFSGFTMMQRQTGLRSLWEDRLEANWVSVMLTPISASLAWFPIPSSVQPVQSFYLSVLPPLTRCLILTVTDGCAAPDILAQSMKNRKFLSVKVPHPFLQGRNYTYHLTCFLVLVARTESQGYHKGTLEQWQSALSSLWNAGNKKLEASWELEDLHIMSTKFMFNLEIISKRAGWLHLSLRTEKSPMNCSDWIEREFVSNCISKFKPSRLASCPAGLFKVYRLENLYSPNF